MYQQVVFDFSPIDYEVNEVDIGAIPRSFGSVWQHFLWEIIVFCQNDVLRIIEIVILFAQDLLTGEGQNRRPLGVFPPHWATWDHRITPSLLELESKWTRVFLS